MKIDPIEQYRQLRQELLDEKARIAARLAEIEAALSDQPVPVSAPAKPARRAPRAKGGRVGNDLTLKAAVVKVLSEKPLTKAEILQAVQDLGFTFKTKNPANSLGVVLYGKSPKFINNKGVFSLGKAVAKAAGKAPKKAAKKAEKQAPKKAAKKKPGKRRLSAEARARIVDAQKKRWAKVKAAKAKAARK